MCENCHKPKQTNGTVIDGKYRQLCADCQAKSLRLANSGAAQYSRDRDREAHEADLVQPWDARGNPNKEFIRLYPEEAKMNFSQEELKKHG